MKELYLFFLIFKIEVFVIINLLAGLVINRFF